MQKLARMMDEIRCSWFIGEHVTTERLREHVAMEHAADCASEERDMLYNRLADALGSLACITSDASDMHRAIATASNNERADSRRFVDLCMAAGLLRIGVDGARATRNPKARMAKVDASLARFVAAMDRIKADMDRAKAGAR
jgi:hypothetical protein